MECYLKDILYQKVILKEKEKRYNFMKHINHLEGKTFSYEIFPVKIIFENSLTSIDNSKGNYNYNLFNFFFFSLILIILIINA